MQFIAMQSSCRISNPLINEQNAAALADARVRQHEFCEWIRGLDDLKIIQPHSWNLFTRPRRFGKSLNMDMLKTFFEIGTDPTLFDGLEISKETALCEQHMGKYPVISISLKDVEGTDFQMACAMLGNIISEEAGRFDFLLENDKLTQYEKEKLIYLIPSLRLNPPPFRR